ncbi:ABC transporter substrate-binding protein [Sediminicoccus sp. KRV36]|uniref:ABC transporter substrate-binding protein n=1 Tax=Sediminicoccus sp. KRV36 TaxID=3133721 RepID=UPI00200D03EA|nr:ABC transporter substrate-binding protein [Sediminicoccus rosea]UPY38661.1 ABC transporter substrate-binding protein [Sediminicoccus rosea]
MRRILIALMALAITPAHGQPIPAPLVTPGTLSYGTAATYPPFQFLDEGRIIGFSVDYGEALSSLMGLRPAIMNMDFNGLIPALQARRFDIINSAMRITPERAQQVTLIPYMRIGSNIVVRAGNPRGINGRADVCGRSIAVELGSTMETYAREDDAACRAGGRPGPTVLTFPGRQDATIAVRQGRADAFYDTTPAAARAVALNPGIFAIAGETFGFTENGIALRREDAALATAVIAAMRQLVTNGTYARLLAKWNLPPEVSVTP